MMCAGLTADEVMKVDAHEHYKEYMKGDSHKGDSGRSAGCRINGKLF